MAKLVNAADLKSVVFDFPVQVWVGVLHIILADLAQMVAHGSIQALDRGFNSCNRHVRVSAYGKQRV